MNIKFRQKARETLMQEAAAVSYTSGGQSTLHYGSWSVKILRILKHWHV